VRLKLKSFGNDVHFSECIESAKALIESTDFDMLVLNDSDHENPLISIADNKSIALMYVSNCKSLDPALERFSLSLSFTEEEFFHKVSFNVEYDEADSKVPLIESVISHYGGDTSLAQKVVSSFLEVWEESIEEIFDSFQDDEDKILARKIHSFKGVLSALGETEAAAILRKVEILIKGRNRDSAFKMYPNLKELCAAFANELAESTLLQ